MPEEQEKGEVQTEIIIPCRPIDKISDYAAWEAVWSCIPETNLLKLPLIVQLLNSLIFELNSNKGMVIGMNDAAMNELVDRYIQYAHEVWKVGEALVREEIGERLTTDQLYILRYISKKLKATSTELADEFCVQKSAITAIITRLVEKGLIGRTPDPADRRIIYLTLTEEGTAVFKKMQEKVFKLTKSFITKFDPDEIDHFIRTYEKLAKILREMR